MKTYRVWEVDADRETGEQVSSTNPKAAAEEYCARRDRRATTFPRRRSVIVQAWSGAVFHFDVECVPMPMYAACPMSPPFVKLYQPEVPA